MVRSKGRRLPTFKSLHTTAISGLVFHVLPNSSRAASRHEGKDFECHLNGMFLADFEYLVYQDTLEKLERADICTIMSGVEQPVRI